MKIILLTLLLNFTMLHSSVYQFTFNSIDGEAISLARFKGKKILIVNTASKCGYTPQYEELEKLHQLYKNKLVIIGFPANNFLWQEPGNNQQIKEFCTRKYGVSFILSEKIDVKGAKIHPLFKWLIEQDNPDFKDSIKWNFEKFLLDENGKLIHRYRSKVSPLSPLIVEQL